ncbi:MAG: aspartate carbamoyltransferase catalytic subunit [Phycisphaerales bacterium]
MPHFLGLDGLDRAAIRQLLDRAAVLAAQAHHDPRSSEQHEPLARRNVALLFFESSTRTRASFTIAIRQLGGDVIDVSPASSSQSKGETALDTMRTLHAMGIEHFVIRCAEAGLPHQLATAMDERVKIINAGDGAHEHPTQGLLDLLTLEQRLGSLANRNVAIVGDVQHSRVARSATFGLTAFGANVVLVGPAALVPRELSSLASGPGNVEIDRDFDAVLKRVDAVMMLRVQFERAAGESVGSINDYRKQYSLTTARAALMKPGAVVMHPGPLNRGLEIESSVADDPARSVILAQVRNGVAVRMAVLEALEQPAVDALKPASRVATLS